MANTQLRKQVSIFFSMKDWQAIRFIAAQRKIPMSELCKEMMEGTSNEGADKMPDLRKQYAKHAKGAQ